MDRKIILLFISIVLFTCCQPDSSKDKESKDTDKLDIPEDVSSDVPLKIDDNALEGIIKSFSNPIEMAALVKSVGTEFSLEYLCPTGKFDELTTDTEKAIGLGLLSADLGYLNIYERTSAIVDYITVIKRLADDLKVGQFFDFQTLKRLATNNENLDTLMYLSVRSFNDMDNHLREHNRSNLSTLIVAGVWLEGLYLATQVYDKSKNSEVAERIGEQKIILNDLLIIMKNYKSAPIYQKLIKDFTEFKDVFDGVEITYKYNDPVSVEQDGKLIIEQKTTSSVSITNKQIEKITDIVVKVRNDLINL
jgi:hypothetical protein